MTDSRSWRRGLGRVLAACAVVACVGGCEGGTETAEEPQAGVDRSTPVEVVVMQRRQVETRVPLTGVLEPVHQVDIVAEASGRVTSLRVDVGDRVRAGDTLAVIDDRVPRSRALQARAAVLSAENQLTIARITHESDSRLLESDDISRLEYERSLHAFKQAEAQRLLALAEERLAKKQFEDTRVTSPIAGLVSRRMVEQGAMASQGSVVFRVVDLSSLSIDVGIPQAVISSIRVGTPARVSPTALNGVALEGRVHAMSPQADAQTGAFRTEIRVPNPDGRLKAGLTAACELVLAGERRLFVPDRTVVTRGDGEYVYRIAGGRAVLTRVETGESIGSEVPIRTGLAEGDTVVVVGMKNLGVETPVMIESVNAE